MALRQGAGDDLCMRLKCSDFLYIGLSTELYHLEIGKIKLHQKIKRRRKTVSKKLYMLCPSMNSVK